MSYLDSNSGEARTVIVNLPEAPLKNCDRTEEPIIQIIKDGSDPKVDLIAENCVIVTGDDISILKSIDRLLLNFYGVMN